MDENVMKTELRQCKKPRVQIFYLGKERASRDGGKFSCSAQWLKCCLELLKSVLNMELVLCT